MVSTWGKLQSDTILQRNGLHINLRITFDDIKKATKVVYDNNR